MGSLPLSPHVSPQGPRRQLGVLDAAAVYVGIVVGSGIFFAPSGVAAAAPSPWGAIGLWLLGGFIAGCGALCYAECGARLPHDGGFYIFYRHTLGEGVAFVGGWVAYLITYPASIAVIALVLARYFGEIVPAARDSTTLTAAIAVAVVAGLNVIGVRENAWSQRVLTGTKVAAIVALCAAALIVEPVAAANGTSAAPPAVSFAVVLMALVGVLWTYSGWSDITLISGELRDPARSLGRTVFIGTAALVLVYALVQIAVMALLTPAVAASSPRVLSDAVNVAFGGGAGRLVAALVVVSTLGAINGTMLVVSRLGYAMSHDRVAPAFLGALHETRGTPVHSVVAVFCVTLIYVASSNFRDLLGMFTFSVWLFYGLTTIALLRLRRGRVGEPLRWRAPLGVLPPMVVLGTGFFMTVSLLVDVEQRRLALSGLLLLGGGGPAYFIWRRLQRSAPTP